MSCEPCSSNCFSCNIYGCDICKEGYYLNTNCILCNQPCRTCSSATSCLSCIEGYFLSSDKCYECKVNCKATSEGCQCSTCNEGDYLSNGQCFNCDSNCKTCSGSAITCTSCNEGFGLTSINTCVQCSEPCKECSGENSCSSCIDNYFYFQINAYNVMLIVKQLVMDVNVIVVMMVTI